MHIIVFQISKANMRYFFTQSVYRIETPLTDSKQQS